MNISIIIPLYNNEKYFLDCLSSIECQIDNIYEVIIVDDGSTDQSGAIADGYAKLRKNVHVLHEHNKGPYFARITGLNYASGDYVMYLDSDDMLHPNALKVIMDYIMEFNPDIISFRFSNNENFKTSDDTPMLNPGVYCDQKYIQVKKAVLSGKFNNLCGKVFRLSWVENANIISPDRRILIAEDLLQELVFIDMSKSLLRIDDILYFYRINDSSTTSDFKYSYIEDIEYVIMRIYEYGLKWNLADYSQEGIYQLYINVSKMIIDSCNQENVFYHNNGLDMLSKSLKKFLQKYNTNTIQQCRLDKQFFLYAIYNNNYILLKLLTELSHKARNLIGSKVAV